ncbi:MAG: hypothetical protein ACYC0V_18550, partial [Armatimonadota bacterium]
LFCVTSIASVNATETAWKPVNSWLDMQTLQWRWAVESTAGDQAPYEIAWNITVNGSTGFSAACTGCGFRFIRPAISVNAFQ